MAAAYFFGGTISNFIICRQATIKTYTPKNIQRTAQITNAKLNGNAAAPQKK